MARIASNEVVDAESKIKETKALTEFLKAELQMMIDASDSSVPGVSLTSQAQVKTPRDPLLAPGASKKRTTKSAQ